MNKLAAFAAVAFTLCAGSAFAERFTGVVSDAMCAKNPAQASSPSHAACAKKCIEGGSPAVLIVGSKVYQVSNPDKLKDYAGQKITVDASNNDGTLTIEAVK